MRVVATWNERPGPPAGQSPGKRGQWLGGVCAGLAHRTGVGVGWIRLAFVLGAFLAGVGIALYLTCWLIMPATDADADADEESSGRGGLVVVARACAAVVGLLALGIAGGLAAVFGFGWVVVAAAAVILVGAMVVWRRASPAWALLPVAALSLPALAFAAAGVRLTTRTSPAVVVPASVDAVSAHVFRSGLNTMLIDLRHTPLPTSGTVPLRIDAGVRRTIVALPAGRCVRVVVHYDVEPFAVRMTALLTGRTRPIFSNLVAFGRLYAGSRGVLAQPPVAGAPTVDIDYHSQGGSLYVRDYPDAVNPDVEPDWPGYQVHVEPRPDVQGTPRKAAQRLLAHWRARRAAEVANAEVINALMPGPCAQTAGGRP
jgi:phage shock protein PspC (stress-responsive transcriptional regulator)